LVANPDMRIAVSQQRVYAAILVVKSRRLVPFEPAGIPQISDILVGLFRPIVFTGLADVPRSPGSVRDIVWFSWVPRQSDIGSNHAAAKLKHHTAVNRASAPHRSTRPP